MADWMEAGEGDNHMYRLVPPGQGDAASLARNKHYIGIDSSSWFINKQSSWFTDRTASGTMKITLASGLEEYNAALGTFELDDGARTAPIFDRPVLPDRRYRGGPLTFGVSLTSLNRDTAFAKILKSAATASLNIVSGMVETATSTGPQQILGAAGSELVGGISDALANDADGREPLLGSMGMQGTLQPGDFRLPLMYLVFHRGSQLDPRKLKSGRYGHVRTVLYDGHPLTDGAWILIRLRRSAVYTGVRPWDQRVQSLRGDLLNLVSDVQAGILRPSDALARLRPGGDSQETLFDQFAVLRRIIRDDGVLTPSDASDRVGALAAAFGGARADIESHGRASVEPQAAGAAARITSLKTAVLSGEADADEPWLDNAELELH